MELTAAVIIIIVGVVLIIIGYIGCITPVLPGPPIALISVLLMEFGNVFDYNNGWLIAICVMTAIMFVLDYALPIYMTKQFGGTKQGVRGSAVGVILGIIATSWTGPFALILGPFLGAMVGELIAGKELKDATKIGVGALAGFLLGAFGKISATTVIAITFFWGVIATLIN